MDVAHVAKLANLPLKPGEVEKFQKQFEETLKTIAVINELDTKGVEPTSQVTGLVNVVRQDEVDPSRILPPPMTNNGYFAVPSIFDAQ
ncbi:MAG: aspartyl-tRNA(Asn)/glutamyl-tRNA (Gln) amidotransferase subunit C [Microgenomates group bacterium Gr01-1014_16]|nr:MAG: aspartyl-tRNA(Asn)/glutamyl-tRNA (Gln) amidotransferase subunit C [Microgenomates group bacterium Gr01-1014_16]